MLKLSSIDFAGESIRGFLRLYNFTLYKMLCVLFKLTTGFLQNAQPFNRSNLLFCHVAARVLHSSIGAFFAFKFILKQFSRWTCTFQHPAGYYRSGWTTATEWFRRRRRICHLCRIARGSYPPSAVPEHLLMLAYKPSCYGERTLPGSL